MPSTLLSPHLENRYFWFLTANWFCHRPVRDLDFLCAKTTSLTTLDLTVMTDTNPTETPNQTEILGDSSIQAVEIGQQRVRRLWAGLQKSTPSTMAPSSTKVERFENELALVRLGMAASLFYALRTKHAPTAAHCLEGCHQLLSLGRAIGTR